MSKGHAGAVSKDPFAELTDNDKCAGVYDALEACLDANGRQYRCACP